MKYEKKRLAWFLSMLMVLMLISPMDTAVTFAGKKNVKLKKIALNYSTYKLQKGKKLKLRASFKPKNTTQKKIVWKSSKKKIASVSKKGVVKALKIGKTTITAKVKGTKRKATCKIQVVNKTNDQNAADTPPIHNDPVPQPTSYTPAIPQITPHASAPPAILPTITPKYERPLATAQPVQYIDLTAEGAYQNESPSGAGVINNPDGTITVTFSQQDAALSFFLPDNAQNYYSNYKSVVITYTSEGGDLGHALYDTQMAGPADPNAGKHPDGSSQLKESKEEHTLILKASDDCVGGCIRGFQIFNPNPLNEGQTVTITIKSIIFSDKEQPTEEDLKPVETPAPTDPDVSSKPSALPSTVTPVSTPSSTGTANPTLTPTKTPATVTTSKPTSAPTKKPATETTSKPTSAPTKKPATETTSKPTSAPTQTPATVTTSKPTATPGGTAAPAFHFELTKEGAIHNEAGTAGAAIVNNPDGSVTATLLKQYAALNFFLPDLTKGNYKSVVLTYTSEGGDLGHALFDTETVGVSNTNTGKHANWDKQIKESGTEKTLIFKVTSECKGGFIRGFQIFNPDKLDAGKTIKITIKSLIFSDKENPTSEDLDPNPPTPTPSPTATPTPKPIVTREPGPLGITSPGAEGDDIVWDCITFGSYYQSLYEPKEPPQNPVVNTEYKDSDGTSMIYTGGKYYKKEPIKWRVLSVDENDALIVADQLLDTQPFHNQNCSEITWEDSSIRQWLNHDFYSAAFIEEEQNAILSTTVSTEDNPQYGTANGSVTTDKLYLLSAEEVRNKNYGFAMYHEINSQTRQVKNTAYASAKGTWADDAGNGWWWQRSLGSFPFNAVYAGSDGVADCSGYIVVNEGGGVRPAMHLNLLSASWKQAGQVKTTCASELEPTPTPTESPEKKVSLSEVVIDSNCGFYDMDSDTIRVNDTRTGDNDTTFMHLPIPVTVTPGQKLKVTVSGTSWGSSDFRIWTVPQGVETSGDFVENNSIFLNPTIKEDKSFTGTVELTAKGADCNRITLKPSNGTKITNLIISEIKVELVPPEPSAASP